MQHAQRAHQHQQRMALSVHPGLSHQGQFQHTSKVRCSCVPLCLLACLPACWCSIVCALLFDDLHSACWCQRQHGGAIKQCCPCP